ncbi:MAG: hypothetical protein WAW39_21295, partial [Prosthecobacter sp.]
LWHCGAVTLTLTFTLAALAATGLQAQTIEFVVPAIPPARAESAATAPAPSATPPAAAKPGKLDEGRLAGIEIRMMRSGEEGRLSDEELKPRTKLIETSPDLGPYLVEIADRMIAQKSDYVHHIFDAIAQRKDIDPKAIERYVALTEKILAQVKSSAELDRAQRSILYGMNDVLAAHPSAAGERLLIRMQQIGLGGLVAESLAKIGGPQALTALQQEVSEYEELVKSDPENEALRLQARRIKNCMETLRARLAQAPAKP